MARNDFTLSGHADTDRVEYKEDSRRLCATECSAVNDQGNDIQRLVIGVVDSVTGSAGCECHITGFDGNDCSVVVVFCLSRKDIVDFGIALVHVETDSGVRGNRGMCKYPALPVQFLYRVDQMPDRDVSVGSELSLGFLDVSLVSFSDHTVSPFFVLQTDLSP